MTMAAIKDQIEKLINDNHIMVFSKSYCGYCARAKTMLKKYSRNVKYWDIDLEPNGKQIQNVLNRRSGMTTVPQVFIGQQLVGGASEVAELERRGLLRNKITNGSPASTELSPSVPKQTQRDMQSQSYGRLPPNNQMQQHMFV